MASTFPTETSSASEELLACILQGNPWPDYLLRRALVEDQGRQLFSVVIERLGDLFEPALCDQYARLFSRVVELLRPEWKAADLLARYERVRQVRRCEHNDVQNVYVLSRVTLGADVAVTSVLMDAARQRFPEATIRFGGPRKNYELFAADGRVVHNPVAYPRTGTLAERLEKWEQLSIHNSIVVDPDSRLTQLGILPVCDEQDYFFFESRACGAGSDDALPQLSSAWCQDVFGVAGHAWLAPEPVPMPAEVAVSFGVGENSAKRVAGEFEEELLHMLTGFGMSVIVDEGGGGEETERVRELCRRVPGVERFSGSFAQFASMIKQARMYVGYDSAGQHVAAAAGVPLLTIFAGHPSERMFERWKPWGPGERAVVKLGSCEASQALQRTAAALDRLLAGKGQTHA